MVQIIDQKIIYTVKEGVDSALVLKSSDFPEFDEIRMDFKTVDSIQAIPINTFSSLDGTIQVDETLDGITLIINISNDLSATLKKSKLFFDIKFRLGNVVSDIVIPGEIIRQNTVTRI